MKGLLPKTKEKSNKQYSCKNQTITNISLVSRIKKNF